MRMRWMAVVAMGVLCAAASARADVDIESIQGLLKTLDGPAATESPTVYQDERGYVKFVGAAPGSAFQVDTANKAVGTADSAKAFLGTHRAAFGIGASSTLTEKRSNTHAGATYVRLDQGVGGVPVYGAQAVVQVNADGNIVNIASDVARDTSPVDNGDVSLTPAVSVADASLAARMYVDGLFNKVGLPQLFVVGSPKLYIFAPSVLGLSGGMRLVWQLEVSAIAGELVRQEVFVDAASGETIFHYSKLTRVIDREIYDYENRITPPLNPVREESDPPVGIMEVDTLYDYIGDTYNFYFEQHGRDSIDDDGMTIIGNARLPEDNASWDGESLTFGTDYGADDIVGHEYAHGVTEYTSNLIYFGFSGAINESFSDMWGEWVDLTNGKGDDQPAARWWCGEDIGDADNSVPQSADVVGSAAIRNMQDPTIFGDPDRLLSPNLASPTSFFDNGGVHINSGIGNKLCYLLTDGDTFNGETVRGIGISRAADLFYTANLLLTPTSDYFDLYVALGAASATLGYTFDERLNVAAAGRAVEIAPSLFFAEASLQGFRAVPARRESGEPVIALSWINPPLEVLSNVTVVRSVLGFPSGPTDGTVITTAKVEKHLDALELQEGVTYYYALFAELTTGFPEIAYAKATAGATFAPPVVEPFGAGASATGRLSTIDLSFSQLTFTPTGQATGTPGSNQRGVGYEGYQVQFTPGVFDFPVARDGNGGSQNLPLLDDELVRYSLGDLAVPFFGRWYSSISLSSNGYVVFGQLSEDTLINDTLASVLALPRIAFLSGDLDPSQAGSVWSKFLDDRMVITFQDVPEFSFDNFLPHGNSVQVEIFYTGTIRITYGSLASDPDFPLEAVCGISDGNGVAVDPADLFPSEDLESIDMRVDLSSLPDVPTRLTFAPRGGVDGEAGDRIRFTATTVLPQGASGTPVLFAEWNVGGAVPFADNGDGTGNFDWQSAPGQEGIYTVRVKAVLGDQQAYQDVRIDLLDADLLPSVTRLSISTQTPFEDPTISRFVGDDKPLIAGYTYVNPLPTNDSYNEGSSLIIWVRNGQTASALLNARQVPASQTRPGDQWYFRIIPIAANFVAGEPASSPVVTIAGFPDITSVTPNFGTIYGGDKIRIKGSRMRGVLRVTFGGVEAAGIRAISDTEVEVTTPVHLPGTVPIAVTTSTGTGSILNAFTFLGDGGDFPRSDVNADGHINATDVQLVINAVLEISGVKAAFNGDTNQDGAVNASDIQAVVNSALHRD